jgi:cold shock CspA family protein/ribosome-associated translation inhibitor RaiA
MEIHWIDLDEIEAADRTRIEARLRALAEAHTDLIGVRITGRSTRHHRHGEQEVRVTAEVRGRTVTAARTRSDLGLSLNEAIDVFEGELHKLRERRRDRREPRAPQPSLRGVVRRLFPDEGYGFVRTDDGKDVYFHRNAVHGGLSFTKLEEGQHVVLDVEPGKKGPQARTIQPPPPA